VPAESCRTYFYGSIFIHGRSVGVLVSATPNVAFCVPARDRDLRPVLGEAVPPLAPRHQIRRTCLGAGVNPVSGGRPFLPRTWQPRRWPCPRNLRSWSPRRRSGGSGPAPGRQRPGPADGLAALQLPAPPAARWHLVEPVDFVMKRRMLGGIRARAEAGTGLAAGTSR